MLLSKLSNIFDKDKDINVLMLGHSGVGKTTILASLYNEFAKNMFDKSISLKADDETRKKLNEQLVDLKEGLQADKFIFVPKLKGTTGITNYKFYLEDNDGNKIVNLNFIDIRGGDVVDNQSKITNKIKAANIILVPIDATAMIEKDERNKNYHDRINQPDEIRNILSEIIKTDAEKMVIFSPVKSESYFDNLFQLERIFERKYRDILRLFQNKSNILVSYIPIKTIGDIKFIEIQKNNDNPIFVFAPSKFEASYNPEYVEQIFILILLFTFAQKYKTLRFFQRAVKKDIESIYKEYKKELKENIIKYQHNSHLLDLKRD